MCKKIKYGCFFEKKFVELFWKSFSGRKSSLEPSFFEFLTGFHMVWKNQESWEIWWNAFWGNRYSIWCGMTQKWKTNCWRYHHFTHVYQKPQSYEVRFLRYGVRQTEFFVILVYFLPFYPLTTQKIKILKKKKKKKTVYVFILHMSIKNHDYICFLRYGVQQKQFFVILGHVLAFYPTIDPEN